MAVRIQRKRSKGWRMPVGAVYVGRPTKFGNPWQVGDRIDGQRVTHRIAADWYRKNVTADSAMGRDAVAELRGKDLACWCPLDQPCHADVLLEIANAPIAQDGEALRAPHAVSPSEVSERAPSGEPNPDPSDLLR
jgi:hypothetical protein